MRTWVWQELPQAATSVPAVDDLRARKVAAMDKRKKETAHG